MAHGHSRNYTTLTDATFEGNLPFVLAFMNAWNWVDTGHPN